MYSCKKYFVSNNQHSSNKFKYKEGIYYLLHRKELLDKKNTLQELINSESGYIVIFEETSYEQDISDLDIPDKLLKRFPRHFYTGKIRVPEITLSKYSNVQIVKHQFLVVSNSIVTMDTGEEIVNKNDISWFKDDMSCEFLGGTFCIPRLYYHESYIKPNKVKVEFSEVEELKGKYIFIPAWYTKNICHWICDVLPRVGLASKMLPENFKFVLPEGTNKTSKETLDLLGINNERIIWYNNNKSFFLDNCYLISRVASQYNFFSDYFFDFYNQLSNRVLSKENEREQNPNIYLSRKDSIKRKCLNEDLLEKKLEILGFKIVVLSDLSFEDRIRLFRNTKVLLGASGAGLVHSIFLKEFSHLIVIGTQIMNQNSNMFARIAKRKNFKLSIFNVEALNPEDINSSWNAPLEQIVNKIKTITS